MNDTTTTVFAYIGLYVTCAGVSALIGWIIADWQYRRWVKRTTAAVHRAIAAEPDPQSPACS